MAGTLSVVVVCLLCLVSGTAAFEARITKPLNCDRNEVRFHRGHQYMYHYNTTVETTFVGTTTSKSAFKLDCDVVVEARRKCEGYLNVTLCSVYHRQPGESNVYNKDATLSTEITNLLSRELYFQFDRGTIRPHTIVVDSEETHDALNIKRGILSALQIKIVTEEPGDEIHTMETKDLLGTCPTEYVVESPDKVLTYRDITKCQIPHYSYRQHNMFSLIKRVYGGYLNGPVDELIYPFNSTIKCEHTLGDKHRLEETKCLQQQVFRPFAREEPIVASCMANISQHLILQETRDLQESNVNRKMRGKKSGSLGYLFDENEFGDNILVTKVDISNWLHKLTIYNGSLETTPKLFHEFLWFLRQAQTNDLLEVLADVWNCHGNEGNFCNRRLQKLEQDYLQDGLLACGTDACVSAFTQAIRAGHVSRWLQYMFIYDVALYHETSTEVANTMLDMCLERNSQSCWFPLSIMINKMATAGTTTVDLESGPIYRTLHHVRETIGDTCQNGIPSTLDLPENQNAIDELLQMIRVLGNIGAPVQYVYDSKYVGMEGQPEDRRLVSVLLQCASNTDLPHKVAKSVILALHKMTFTKEIIDVLLDIYADVNRAPSTRTTIFSQLVIQPDSDLAARLNELIHAEKMSYMKHYMVTYIKTLLQNDQPDLHNLRNIWKEIIDADSRDFPYVYHRVGKSKFVEMSRYIKLPLQIDYYGFQIELDTVYNIRSPVVNAVVLRVNYFDGHKVNLLEFSADIDDFDVIWDSIKRFPLPRTFENSGGYRREETVFDTLQKDIAAAILDLFDQISLSQENTPDGIIHVKVLGQEMFFLEVRDLLTIFQNNPQQSIYNFDMGKVQAFLEQLPIYRTSSTSVVDIVKVLPTVGGFPINMTVSVATTTGLEFDAKLTMPDLINLSTDVQLDASLKTHTAVHFNGELMTKCGQHSLSGARGSSAGIVQMSISPSLRINTQPEKPKVVDFSLSQTNTDAKYTMAKLSGHMYLIHSSGEEEIAEDPEFQTTIEDCDTGLVHLVTGNQLCFTSVYPNTTSSDRHAYFPLSGPFHFSLDTRKVETATLLLSFVRIQGDDEHTWINLTRQGQENTVGLSLHWHEKEHLRLLELMIPEAQIHLYAKYDYKWSYGVNSTGYELFDVHLNVADTTWNRFLARKRTERGLNKQRTSTRTTRKIVNVILALPGVSLDIDVNSFKNRTRGHYNTAINITYHCVKARPLLYLLHWNHTLAEQNGDVSKVEIVNDAVIGYNRNLWAANDYMQLKLPGLKISLDNSMEANVSHANRHTVIVYTGIDEQEHTVTMNAHVVNGTNATYNTYDYFMLLSHSGVSYDLSLRGHMKGISDNLNLVTEIEPVAKSVQVTPQVEDGSEGSSGEDPCLEKLGKILMDLNIRYVTVPDGIEMRWDYNYTRKVCGGHDGYHSTGLYGRQGINARWNFHYWGNIDMTVTKSRDVVGQQEAVVRSKSYSGKFRAQMHSIPVIFLIGFSSEILNTSHVFSFTESFGKNRNITILFQHQLQTPLPMINFNVKNVYVWKGHLIHTTEITSAWLDVNTVTTYNASFWFRRIDVDMHGYVDSRLPWLPGRTNVTGHYERSDDVLPLVLMVLERSNSTMEIKADMFNTTFNTITLTYQKPGEEATHLLTWHMALSSTRASTHTLIWNPDLVKVASVSRLNQLQLTLVEVGTIVLENANKPVMFMLIPFTDMTLGAFLESYLYPYLRFPATNTDSESSNVNENPQITSEQRKIEVAGDLVAKSLSKTMGSTLIAIGGYIPRPPWIVKRLMDILIRPSLEKILADSRVTFTSPLLGRWHSLIEKPRETYGFRYLEGVYGHLTKSIHTHIGSSTGFVVNKQYLITYSSHIYHIPDDEAADCVHLLAGDFKRETFAILLSRQGITVVTNEMSVTLEYGGNVFRDNCPRRVGLPLGRKESRIHVYKERDDVVLTTKYGVQVSCLPRRDVCRIEVMKTHLRNSWGLLGTNDQERGSDFQLPNKYITQDIHTFIQSYTVGGPPRCISPESRQPVRLDEALNPHIPVNVETLCSVEMANECNRQFDRAAQSQCYPKIQYQQFLDNCLSEAKSCDRVATDVCKHIRAYEYACHLKVSYYSIAVDCDLDIPSSTDGGSRRPVDVVMVVSNVLESSLTDIDGHVETFLHVVKYNIRNVQFGIIGYGGDSQINDALDPTVSIRHMVALDTLDVGTANSPWRRAWKRFPNVVTLNEALDMATHYPYRFNTQRVVIVVSREKPNITDEVKAKVKNMNIIVNSFGDYETVDYSDKVNGINWDGTVVYRDWLSSYRMMSLPEGSLVELVVDTKGAIFNADSITGRRKKRLKFIVKHIKEQIKLNNFC